MSDAQHTVPQSAPMLSITGASAAIDFYKKAFGATELMRIGDPGGKVGHAELQIGNALIMIADEYEELAKIGWVKSPQTLGGSSVILHIYVDDVDALTEQAVAAGAKALSPVEDQFYGDRRVRLADPFGHLWMFATRKEHLTPEEIQKRAALS